MQLLAWNVRHQTIIFLAALSLKSYQCGQTKVATMHMHVANGTQSEVAAIYNLTSNTFTPFHIAEAPQSSGHILLPDGQGLIVGGECTVVTTDMMTVANYT